MEEGFDRRRAKRVALDGSVKFLLRGAIEGQGSLLDISESGLALIADMQAAENDDIVVYIDGVGRLAGRVVRVFDGGVGIALILSNVQRRFMGERIATALTGAPYLRLAEQRDHARIRYNIETTARLCADGQDIPCLLSDMSRSGCSLKAETLPPVGAEITIGAFYGKVVRHTPEGFAIKFIRPVRSSASGGESEKVA